MTSPARISALLLAAAAIVVAALLFVAGTATCTAGEPQAATGLDGVSARLAYNIACRPALGVERAVEALVRLVVG